MSEPVIYIEKFLIKEVADLFFKMMQEPYVHWERRPDAPRSEHWSNDFDTPYTYGRGRGERTYQAKPMPAVVEIVRERIFDLTGVYHQGCFCNRYDGAKDWLGWHSDDDPGINHEDPISVVTLGQPRAIQYRSVHRHEYPEEVVETRGSIHEVMLEHGSLFIMKPGMQSTHMHRIPKAGFTAGIRVSLTYRSLLSLGERFTRAVVQNG